MKDIVSDTEPIPISLTSSQVTSESYSTLGHDPMGDESSGYKQEQEKGLFSNVVIKDLSIRGASWLCVSYSTNE